MANSLVISIYPTFSHLFSSDKLVYVFLGLFLYTWLYSTRENENISVKLFLRKMSIMSESFWFMIYSKDSKGIGPKYNPDPEFMSNIRASTSKQIIFIRHGESDWNNVFNKGINISFVWRLLNSLYEEFLMLFVMNSKFLDSPLNGEGIEQALELREFIERLGGEGQDAEFREILAVLAGEKGSSVIATSSLRRAIATTTLALWPRVDRSHEKIHVLSCLQEISRNIDTRAISRPKEIADLPFSRIARHCGVSETESFDRNAVYDVSENFGNKTRSFYGIKRLRAFNEWAFARPEATIIAGGHSLWFKSFFQTYLSHRFEHDAKKKKIANSGAVVFTLHRSEIPGSDTLYKIDESSIRVLYGGFTTK